MHIDKSRFCINRIAIPKLGLRDFYNVVSQMGLSFVELRNDLNGMGVIDDLSPKDAKNMASDIGVNVLTINTIQKFNLISHQEKTIEEIKKMIELCKLIDCPAIVLCPDNDIDDQQNTQKYIENTAMSLKKYGALFKDAEILALVEPLGFETTSSIRTKNMALEAINASGYDSSVYKIVHDTFHHHIAKEIECFANFTGLVHISGVNNTDIPIDQIHDKHRVLIDEKDILKNKKQMEIFESSGYKGCYSFEPFSKDIQDLSVEDFMCQIKKSIEFLTQ